MTYTLVDDALTERLGDEKERRRWLVLEPHPDFPGQWLVNSFDPEMFYLLGDFIGGYRAVAPSRLVEFLEAAKLCGYEVAFFDDPVGILAEYDGLNDPPDVTINSPLDGTINGFLPYQVQGFNYLRGVEGGVAMWSTGTGKTVLASALLQHHLEHKTFEIAWFVVKSNNKVNTQRSLQRLAGLQSVVVSGDKQARERFYVGLADSQKPTICITNYEKFRVDHELMLPLFEDRDVFIIWDEMPTKLKSRSSRLYQSVCECLYTSPAPQVSYEKRRPRSLRQYMLSATPIENDPEDWFNCVRLLDPRVYGTVKQFRDEYVARYSFFDRNKPEAWHRLDKMGLKAAHITHQVDKNDPDIAAQFPDVLHEPFYIDWDEQDRKIYDLATVEAENIGFDDVNPLALITVLQMLCDAPSMVRDSGTFYAAYENALQSWLEEGGEEPQRKGSEAAHRLVEALEGRSLVNDRHTKLETLRSLLLEVHPDEKVVIFSSFNNGLMPVLEGSLNAWSVPYVRYSGTQAVRQEAQDRFASDGSCRVFLSSDLGSDSINLEQASVVIHFDLPWKWSTYVQRQNRIHRVTSTHQKVRFYTLMMANSVEDRKWTILRRKMGYHEGVFKGAIADSSASARMTKEDLTYVLTGKR